MENKKYTDVVVRHTTNACEKDVNPLAIADIILDVSGAPSKSIGVVVSEENVLLVCSYDDSLHYYTVDTPAESGAGFGYEPGDAMKAIFEEIGRRIGDNDRLMSGGQQDFTALAEEGDDSCNQDAPVVSTFDDLEYELNEIIEEREIDWE